MKKYINVSGRTLSLTGGRLLPPFEYCELDADSRDQKFVKRGHLLERPSDKVEIKKTEPKQEETTEVIVDETADKVDPPVEESKKKSTTAKKAER